jgi:uroporphyrinogen III methyltransferase/synthase
VKPILGRVYIIGAGPGDPGLITARGVRLLADAAVVVYDLAVEATLRWARPDAERIAAGAPAERELSQDALSMLVADKARDGHIVARLKWGDPFVFDSGAKEALFLHEQGVPFEIVPGIPIGIGATAYAGIPLTYPDAGDALVFLRGYEGRTAELPDIDWEALTRLDGTWACFVGGRLVPTMLQQLIAHGASPESAAALIYRGTEPNQRTVTGTIAELLASTSADTPVEPAVLVVGASIGLRDHLRWFDERPLFGRRVVVTRSQEQARELIERLENAGAQALQAPTFRLAPPDDPEAIDRAAASVDDYQWVVFESANAVTRFLAALARGPRDLRALGGVSVCAIGPFTADRLIAAGITPDVVAAELGTETLGDAIDAKARVAGQRVLVIRPDHQRDVVGEDLARRGAAVTDLVAYRTASAPADSAAAQELYRMLLDGKIDAVTFTNPTAVTRFATLIGAEQAADLLNTTVVATIGPVTAAAVMEMGIEHPLIAETYTVEGLVDSLVKHFNRA